MVWTFLITDSRLKKVTPVNNKVALYCTIQNCNVLQNLSSKFKWRMVQLEKASTDTY